MQLFPMSNRSSLWKYLWWMSSHNDFYCAKLLCIFTLIKYD